MMAEEKYEEWYLKKMLEAKNHKMKSEKKKIGEAETEPELDRNRVPQIPKEWIAKKDEQRRQ